MKTITLIYVLSVSVAYADCNGYNHAQIQTLQSGQKHLQLEQRHIQAEQLRMNAELNRMRQQGQQLRWQEIERGSYRPIPKPVDQIEQRHLPKSRH